MEIWFYHLERQSLEAVLPTLIEKGVGRGWRVVVQTVDDLRLKALDDLLWTYKPESFLAHGTARDKNAASQPVLITTGPDNPNGAGLRIFVEGAEVALDPGAPPCERVILAFNGANEAELDAARRQWTRLKGEGFSLVYMRQDAAGRWDRQM